MHIKVAYMANNVALGIVFQKKMIWLVGVLYKHACITNSTLMHAYVVGDAGLVEVIWLSRIRDVTF